MAIERNGFENVFDNFFYYPKVIVEKSYDFVTSTIRYLSSFVFTDKNLTDRKIEKISNLSEINSLVSLAKKAEKAKNIFWMPHPEKAKGKTFFPSHGIDLLDSRFWGCREVGSVFHSNDPQERQRNIHKALESSKNNAFLKWLASSDPIIKLKGDDFYFMNCTDFVYKMLFDAKLITKEEIYRRYEEEYQNKGKDKFYGFDLKRFKPLDYKIKSGDIVLLFNKNNEPIHMLIYTENNNAIGLWNDITYFSPKELPLKDILEYRNISNERPLSLKYASFH